MSGPFGSSQWMYQSAAGFYPFAIDQSLRINDDDTAYLSRAFTAGNRKTWTWSGWVKRGNLGTTQGIFASNTSGNVGQFYFNSSDNLDFYDVTYPLTTSAVFRDTSAWYHLVLAVDTTQATASNRVKLYVNGTRVTAFSTETYPPQNTDGYFNNSYTHFLGRVHGSGGASFQYDGYQSEINFIDGQALDATSFGEFKSGVWIPKQYGGTYGTNGFRLSFADSANIGDDTSGNTNDWTANSLVATDVLLDSPTNNFATWNPLDNTGTTLSEGNLSFSGGATSLCGGTIGVSSGKWYWECQLRSTINSTNPFILAFVSTGDTKHENYTQGVLIYSDNSAINKLWHYQSGTKVQEINIPSAMQGFAVGDIIQFAYDGDTGKVWIGVDNTWADNSGGTTGDPSTGSNPTFTLSDPTLPMKALKEHAGVAWSGIVNFGQDSSFAGTKARQGNADANGIGDFYYDPSDYLAICTANLPDPVIDPAQDDVPSDYFNTITYDNTGGSYPEVVTGVGFQPDLIWIKSRSQAYPHYLFDAVRGTGVTHLSSNTTGAEGWDGVTDLDSFDSDGFTIGAGDGIGDTSAVAWNWLAGNGTSSNTDGSITSTVSVNQKAGFSIATFTTTGVDATIGHGLGKAPNVIFAKSRNSTYNWDVYHSAIPAAQDKRLILNSTAAVASSTGWNNTAPTSSVVHWDGAFYGSGYNVVMYCFAEVEGYSKFGSFVGNDNADGPFVYLGFRPSLLILKNASATQPWVMIDSTRSTYNVSANKLYPNASDAENSTSTDNSIDFLSNGFKPRGDAATNDATNGPSNTIIYMAFAENPFKYANAR